MRMKLWKPNEPFQPNPHPYALVQLSRSQSRDGRFFSKILQYCMNLHSISSVYKCEYTRFNESHGLVKMTPDHWHSKTIATGFQPQRPSLVHRNLASKALKQQRHLIEKQPKSYFTPLS